MARIILLLGIWALLISIILWVGIGYLLLAVSLLEIAIIALPMFPKWARSKFGEAFLGRSYVQEYSPWFEKQRNSKRFWRGFLATNVVLLAIAVFVILKLNIKVIELL